MNSLPNISKSKLNLHRKLTTATLLNIQLAYLAMNPLNVVIQIISRQHITPCIIVFPPVFITTTFFTIQIFPLHPRPPSKLKTLPKAYHSPLDTLRSLLAPLLAARSFFSTHLGGPTTQKESTLTSRDVTVQPHPSTDTRLKPFQPKGSWAAAVEKPTPGCCE